GPRAGSTCSAGGVMIRAGDNAVGAPPACGGRSDEEERRR
ncbi:MAG TPA: hypothetical protein VN871_17685, partial [Mycobacterium sp.]|nr:hypothetical protein [Mycobacterium sp.]